MKKSFFKKLSFVLALAMIVSVIAPAAGAFAATSPKISTAKKYLFLGQTNEYDFNVSNKVSGSTYAWSSSNESVAVVDAANGLTTGVSVGTATISLKVKVKTKTYTSKATVIVKDNIKTVAITNKPADDTLAVGAPNDFNRSFTTQGGSSKKTTSVTRWTVTDADGKATTDASITTAGLFTATAAGTYKITANAFQSTAKYEAWKTSGTGILATDTYTVTVVPSIVSTKQADADTFIVTFDSDMSKTDIKTASLLYQVIGGKSVITGTEKIKSVSLDTTGKIATVDTYAPFTQDNDYNFVYGKLTGTFKAAKADISNIASIEFKDFSIDSSVGYADMLASIVAYNSDNVVIYSGTALSSYLTFTYDGDYNKGCVSGTTAFLYADGNSAKITAKFEAVVYDSATKAFKTLSFTDDAIATAGNKNVITSGSMQFAAPLVADTTVNASLTYSATGVTVAANDSNRIVVKYTKNTDTSTVLYSNSSDFTFKTTDATKLVVGGYNMYPISAGTVTVLVYSGTTQVGAFDVTIVNARSFAAATADSNYVSVGNSNADSTGTDVTVTIADSLNSAVSATGVNINKVAGPTGIAPDIQYNISTAGKVVLNVKGYLAGPTAATVGQYSYKITIAALGTTKDVYLTINVVDATSAGAQAVASYKVELSKDTVDVKGVTSSAIDINVYGYNASGVKVSHLTSGYAIEVLDTNGNAPTNGSTTTSIPIVKSLPGGAVTSDAVATYVVKATVIGAPIGISGTPSYRAVGAYLGSDSFTVTDTTTKTAVLDSWYASVSKGTVYAAVKDVMTVTVNGQSADAQIDKIDYTLGSTGIISTDASIAVGDNIYVSAVYYKVTNDDGSYFLYKINVSQSIGITN